MRAGYRRVSVEEHPPRNDLGVPGAKRCIWRACDRDRPRRADRDLYARGRQEIGLIQVLFDDLELTLDEAPPGRDPLMQVEFYAVVAYRDRGALVR